MEMPSSRHSRLRKLVKVLPCLNLTLGNTNFQGNLIVSLAQAGAGNQEDRENSRWPGQDLISRELVPAPTDIAGVPGYRPALDPQSAGVRNIVAFSVASNPGQVFLSGDQGASWIEISGRAAAAVAVIERRFRLAAGWCFVGAALAFVSAIGNFGHFPGYRRCDRP